MDRQDRKDLSVRSECEILTVPADFVVPKYDGGTDIRLIPEFGVIFSETTESVGI